MLYAIKKIEAQKRSVLSENGNNGARGNVTLRVSPTHHPIRGQPQVIGRHDFTAPSAFCPPAGEAWLRLSKRFVRVHDDYDNTTSS